VNGQHPLLKHFHNELPLLLVELNISWLLLLCRHG